MIGVALNKAYAPFFERDLNAAAASAHVASGVLDLVRRGMGWDDSGWGQGHGGQQSKKERRRGAGTQHEPIVIISPRLLKPVFSIGR